MAEFFGRAMSVGLCQPPNFALFFIFKKKRLTLPLIIKPLQLRPSKELNMQFTP